MNTNTIVQVICNTKEDFPEIGEMFKFNDKYYPVKQVKISFKMKKMWFVNIII